MSDDKREKLLLDEARRSSVIYNERATEFSKRIEAFENWLRNLEFRAESEVLFGLQERYLLRFTNTTGGWWLQVYVRDDDLVYVPFKSLTNCSIEIKTAAVKVFPVLLENLITAQREALDSIEAAHKALDDMAATVGRFEEETE